MGEFVGDETGKIDVARVGSGAVGVGRVIVGAKVVGGLVGVGMVAVGRGAAVERVTNGAEGSGGSVGSMTNVVSPFFPLFFPLPIFPLPSSSSSPSSIVPPLEPPLLVVLGLFIMMGARLGESLCGIIDCALPSVESLSAMTIFISPIKWRRGASSAA